MKFNRRRGVSPVIEALLVTAVALGAGGGLFYGFYSGLLGTTSEQAAITVQQLSLSMGTNGAVFSITLKNGGNVPFTSTGLKVVISALPAVGTTRGATCGGIPISKSYGLSACLDVVTV